MQKNKIFALIDKAVYDFGLIKNGDKILLGVSGGKDSTLLAQYFSHRMKRRGEHFTFSALHVATITEGSAAPTLFSDKVREAFLDWGVDLKSVTIDLKARLKDSHKLNCYWCALNRRMTLNNYAMDHGYNRLALGHHLDDVLETLLMNALDKCTLSTMIPDLKYDKYPVDIIRPLYYLTEKKISAYIKSLGLPTDKCTCPLESDSKRKVARSRLDALTNSRDDLKMNLLKAIMNVQNDYLPAIKTKE